MPERINENGMSVITYYVTKYFYSIQF